MDDGLSRSVERRWQRLRQEARREWARRARTPGATSAGPAARRRGALAAAVVAAKITIIALLPFVVMLRTAVYVAYRQSSALLAIAAGGVLTLLVASAYASWVAHRVSGRPRVVAMAKWVAMPLVLAYLAHGLLYLSSANAKSDQVKAQFTAVHPVLRMALATVILADREIVVTDMRRHLEDYGRMTLPPDETSLHLEQPDGWVHAVDLRTAGRNEVANRLVELYFRAMGFRTLRHVGTADHLHVALRPR